MNTQGKAPKRFMRLLILCCIALLAAGCQEVSDETQDKISAQTRELTISEARWEDDATVLKIEGKGATHNTVAIYNAESDELLGETHTKENGEWKLTLSPQNTLCTIRAESDDDEDEYTLRSSSRDCATTQSAGSDQYQIFAVNDLGMHCMDDDFSVFSILPPFNTQHAQVVKKGGTPTLLDPSSVEVRYSAIADASGSINSTSIGKTNFWEHAEKLFGAALEPDVGLTGAKMPSQTNGTQVFAEYDAQHKRHVAAGIPITPRDDFGQQNFYPMFRIEAVDKASGQVLTSVDSVLPVSEEMACSDCHHTGREAANIATSTRYGQIQWSEASKSSVQYKENILLLHDAKHNTSLIDNQPVLCAQCHYSPALDLAGAGPQGQQTQTSLLSFAIHRRHGETLDGSMPLSDSQAIIGESGTSSCYNCHPGKETQCFRGAMANANLSCQDCHGGMLAVGGVYPLKSGQTRKPWQDLPKCQSCHTGDAMDYQGTSMIRRIAFDPDDKAATPLLADNKRFAESDTNLYRFSSGHGGMDCTSCHGSPHAIWPNADDNANDNVAAKQIQGYAGTITECTSCHTKNSLPMTLAGPHGMHNVNDPRWTEDHGDFYEDNPRSCQSCHGANLEGTRLSRTTVDRTLVTDDDDNETLWIAKGTKISCTICHSSPDEDDEENENEEGDEDEKNDDSEESDDDDEKEDDD